ncbi:MAG: Hpt domain-containing protein [Rhodobacteraceae bacterium]|nr:Hpt domain-containing protein [Paracoccaceae bacterium]
MIDWERMHDLCSEIGPDDFDEVVSLFLDEADTVVSRIPTLTDARAIERDLHFLKGSALNLGFADLANICQAGERSAASGHSDIDLHHIVATYQRSRQSFLGGIKTVVAA